jgi:hypothetical protein
MKLNNQVLCIQDSFYQIVVLLIKNMKIIFNFFLKFVIIFDKNVAYSNHNILPF